MTTASSAERGGLDREHGGDLARRDADGLQQPDLAVLRAGAGADQDRHDREDHDEQHDRVGRQDDRQRLRVAQRVRALVLPGLDGRGCRAARTAAARAAKAGAAAGSVRRTACVQRQRAAIGLDPLERGARDPGQARVAARIARLGRRDRGADDAQLDRPACSRERERRADAQAERLGEAALEHDPAVARRRALRRHRRVDPRRRAQSPASCSRSSPPSRDGRERARDGLVALGDAGQRRDRARVGLRGHSREHVRAVGGREGPLPRIARGRARPPARARSWPPPRSRAGSSARSRAGASGCPRTRA